MSDASSAAAADKHLGVVARLVGVEVWEEQLEVVYRDGYGRFVACAAAVLGGPDGAPDAVQESFAKALVSPRDDLDSVEAWMWRIVVNTCRDQVRRRRVASLRDVADERVAFVSPGSDPALFDALRRLSSRRRAIVFLRYFADFSVAEIAAACDVAPGTVTATLTQTRGLLRAELEAEASSP